LPIENNLRKYGLSERCARVRAAEIPVLALEERTKDACSKISDEIAAAITSDRAEAIVLGCAGMVDLADELARKHGLPLVDGVTAAVTLAEALVRLGLKTSRIGAYSSPRRKLYSGLLAGFRP
jgi:allantoin racemase